MSSNNISLSSVNIYVMMAYGVVTSWRVVASFTLRSLHPGGIRGCAVPFIQNFDGCLPNYSWSRNRKRQFAVLLELLVTTSRCLQEENGPVHVLITCRCKPSNCIYWSSHVLPLWPSLADVLMARNVKPILLSWLNREWRNIPEHADYVAYATTGTWQCWLCLSAGWSPMPLSS
jgi:hypothetical protein